MNRFQRASDGMDTTAFPTLIQQNGWPVFRPLADITTGWHLTKMMEAARLKRARRRLRGYFLGGGIILAFLYILAAAFIVRLIGVELTRFWSTVLIAAAVLLGGSYGVILFSFTGIHIVRRLLSRQPIMDAED